MRKLITSLLITAAIQAANLAFGVAAARLLGPSDRGIFAYQVTISTIVSTLLSLGIGEAVAYKATEASRLFRHRAYLVLSAIAGTAASLTWLVLYPIFVRDQSDDQFRAYLAFSAYPVLNYLTVCFVGWFAGAGQTTAWNVQRLLVQLMQPLTLCGLLLAARPSIFLFALALILAHVVATAVGLWQLPSLAFRQRSRFADAREILVLGFQSFGGRLSNLIRDNADKLIVGAFAPPEALAQYVVAVSFAQVFNAYSQTVVQLYFSRIASYVTAPKLPLLEPRATLLLIIGAVSAILGSFVFGKWLVVAIFGDKFAQAGDLAPVLVVGMALASIRTLVSAHALALRQPLVTSVVDLYAIGPTLALMVLAVWCAGTWGASAAFVLSQGLVAGAMVLAYLAKNRSIARRLNPWL